MDDIPANGLNFFPGRAAGELARLAAETGRTKTAILRELIRKSSVSQWDFLAPYERLTELGRDFKAAAQAGNMRLLYGFAKEIRGIGAAMPVPGPQRGSAGGRQYTSVRSAKSGSMKFRPGKDEGRRLRILTMRSGLSMNAVLRCLILGFDLPDRQAALAFARLSQLGGMIRHVARALRQARLYRIGADVSGIAREFLLRDMEGDEAREGVGE